MSSNPPSGRPWGGGPTDRPPWEQQPDPDVTQRVSVPGPAWRPTDADPTTRVHRPPTGAPDEQTAQVHRPGPPQAAPTRPDDPDSDLAGSVPAGESRSRRVLRTVSRIFGSSKQPREWTEALTAVQRPVTTGRRIAVTSVRGGAGKTALCALVGSVFAQHRADPVLALDADPDDGSLAWRLGVAASTDLTSLAASPQLHGDLAGLARVLPRTSRELWVAPGEPQAKPQVARDVARGLSRLFAVELLDCGNGITTPAVNTMLADAHVIVVVVPATADGVRATAAALGRVPPGMLQRVVVALNAVDRNGRAVLRQRVAQQRFERLGLPVVAVPYDRHVAAGAVIDPGRLAEPTILAGAQVAAWALARAQEL